MIKHSLLFESNSLIHFKEETCSSWSTFDLRLPSSTIHLETFGSITIPNDAFCFEKSLQNKFWLTENSTFSLHITGTLILHLVLPRVCLVVHMSIEEGQTMMTYNHLETRKRKNPNPYLTFQGPLL